MLALWRGGQRGEHFLLSSFSIHSNDFAKPYWHATFPKKEYHRDRSRSGSIVRFQRQMHGGVDDFASKFPNQGMECYFGICMQMMVLTRFLHQVYLHHDRVFRLTGARIEGDKADFQNR